MRKQRESFLNSDACVWWCLVSWGTIESDSGSVKSPLQAPHTKVCSHTASSHNGMQAFGCGRLADTPMDATRISQFAHVSANGQKEFQHWSVPWLLSIMPMYGAWLTEVAVPQVLWFIFLKKMLYRLISDIPRRVFSGELHMLRFRREFCPRIDVTTEKKTPDVLRPLSCQMESLKRRACAAWKATKRRQLKVDKATCCNL